MLCWGSAGPWEELTATHSRAASAAHSSIPRQAGTAHTSAAEEKAIRTDKKAQPKDRDPRKPAADS